MAKLSIDFSKTQRIVLLIDLNPLLQNPNHHPRYIAAVLAASKTILSFPALSSCLFSFKLFVSSLSPLRSPTVLHRFSDKSPTSLSFNNPCEILSSLSTLLTSLLLSDELKPSPSIASHIASSLLQLAHDYVWDSQIEDHRAPGTQDDLSVVRSNLIVLFSPACRSMKCLAEFVCVDVSDKCLSCFDKYNVKFCDVFGAVNDAFVSRDIHFTWIDVNYDVERIDGKDEADGSVEQLGLFKNGIRNSGWGFCSTDSIVLGSALVSFGLIYPNIGVSLKVLNPSNFCKRIKGQLSLEILDVNGKPLECKGCDLELMHLNIFSKHRSVDILRGLEFRSSESEGFSPGGTFWSNFSDGSLTLHVKSVWRYTKSEKFKECSSNQFLVQELPTKSGRSIKKCLDNCFADKVLKLLSSEAYEFFHEYSIPIWQILLNFLHREGYWALLSLSNSRGNSCMGILKPFTVHSAFLCVIDVGVGLVDNIGGSNLAQIEDVFLKGGVDSQIGISPSRNCSKLDDGKRRKNKKISYKDLTWSSFYKAAFDCSDLELEGVYFATDFSKSKKLKFLKCWMKQAKLSSHYSLSVPGGSKSHHHIEKEINERLTGCYQESEEPLSAPLPPDQCRVQEDTTLASCSETSESFFCNLPKKVQHGIESEGVDLQILAERLVNSSIHCLQQKHESKNSIESQTPMIEPVDSRGSTVAELIHLLLKEPKNLKEKRKDYESAFQATNSSSTLGNIVREYELQILLRMEILQSQIARSIMESMKQKLVKQICSLLEIIQYLVDGGLHGHVSLYDYVERTIKTRYSHNLQDVVNKIYNEMDLLPFGDENEAQVLLFNSEDSNHSWRDKQERYGLAEKKKIYESVSVEDEASQPLEKDDESSQTTWKEEHCRKLSEARDRRERARRFGSFTSRIPDLQRVWAPKQPKVVKLKPEPFQKESSKKRSRRASYSVVKETPMTGNCQGGEERDGHEDHGNNSSRSVSKALFQDDR